MKLTWELFTGFVYSKPYRAKLNGDRIDAWIDPIDDIAYHWSISDGANSGKLLDHGYTDDLDTAKAEAEAAADKLGLTPEGGDAA